MMRRPEASNKKFFICKMENFLLLEVQAKSLKRDYSHSGFFVNWFLFQLNCLSISIENDQKVEILYTFQVIGCTFCVLTCKEDLKKIPLCIAMMSLV